MTNALIILGNQLFPIEHIKKIKHIHIRIIMVTIYVNTNIEQLRLLKQLLKHIHQARDLTRPGLRPGEFWTSRK